MSTWHPDLPALYSGWQDGVRASALLALHREVYGAHEIRGAELPAYGGDVQARGLLRRVRDAARGRGRREMEDNLVLAAWTLDRYGGSHVWTPLHPQEVAGEVTPSELIARRAVAGLDLAGWWDYVVAHAVARLVAEHGRGDDYEDLMDWGISWLADPVMDLTREAGAWYRYRVSPWRGPSGPLPRDGESVVCTARCERREAGGGWTEICSVTVPRGESVRAALSAALPGVPVGELRCVEDLRPDDDPRREVGE